MPITTVLLTSREAESINCYVVDSLRGRPRTQLASQTDDGTLGGLQMDLDRNR